MRYLKPYSLNQSSTPSSQQFGEGSNSFYARVTQVVIDSVDTKAINGVYCTPLENTTGKSEELDDNPIFAYLADNHFCHIPILGEIVKITTIPTPNVEPMVMTSTYYYTAVINAWNHPKDGLFFDVNKPIGVEAVHENFNVNPLENAPGDTIMQGRYGQVIKFFRDPETKTPRIYIGTGRNYQAPATNVVKEDINNDNSSVEFITNGLSLLNSSKKFEKSHRPEQQPNSTSTYKGEQILINSGRIVINTKEDSALISAKKSISLSGTTLNQEADKEICLEAPKVFLGKGSMDSSNPEPVMLGNRTEELLSDILDQLIDVAEAMITATTVSGESLPILTQKGAKVKGVLESLKKKLNPKGSSSLKSKKTFVE